MKNNTYLHIVNLIFFLIFFGFSQKIFAQTPTQEEAQQMRRDAIKCAESYLKGINQLGDISENARRWREDDKTIILDELFASRGVNVYNDLARVRDKQTEKLSIPEYLEKIELWYPQGITFDYRMNAPLNCWMRENGETYYYVKIEVEKKIKGMYVIDNQMHENTDSLDIYVKFNIRATRPKLATDPPKIFKVIAHTPEECPPPNLQAEVKVSSFEEYILKRRAELFVKDYAVTLDLTGHKDVNERFNTLDYFERKDAKVFNDLFPTVLRREFTADEYFSYLESWYQMGIRFKYHNVKATGNIKADSTFIVVEVQANRSINVPQKGYQHQQALLFMVKFPYDFTKGYIGAERSSPRFIEIKERPVKRYPYNYWSIGGQIYASNYFGDLNPINTKSLMSTNPYYTRAGFGIEITKKINARFHARLGFVYVQIRGDDNRTDNNADNFDKYRYLRNLHFRNNLFEFSLTGTFDIFANKDLYYRRKRFNPYIMGGIALLFHNPQARTPIEFGNAWINLQPLRTEGQGKEGYQKPYRTTIITIPLGAGLKYKLSNRIDLGFEAGFRFTFSDYLDDVSGNYPNMWDLESDLARAMSNRTLENTSAGTGANRKFIVDGLAQQLNGYLSYVGTDGKTYQTFNGYGRYGDQRGNSGVNDYYLVTGFRLNYLIGVGKKQVEAEKSKIKYIFRYDK